MAIDTPPPSAPFVVTDGADRFAVQRPWQRPGPDGSDLQAISQLALDRQGRVFVLQRTAPALRIYAPDGTLERSFHHPLLSSGHGLHVDAQDRLWVTTYDAHQILAFDADLRLVMALGSHNMPVWAQPFNNPTGVHVAADGDIYVSDGYGNARIHRFAPDGRLRRSWGGPGRAPGAFNTPHAIWVLPDGRVLCADRDNDRIQVFDGDGTLLAIWDGLVRPMALWAPADGRVLYVSEQVPRISRLDTRDGRVLGRARAFGIYAHGLAGDAAGNLYVAEQGSASWVAHYRKLPAAPATAGVDTGTPLTP
jgi:sugar lactone lactonase YvrE